MLDELSPLPGQSAGDVSFGWIYAKRHTPSSLCCNLLKNLRKMRLFLFYTCTSKYPLCIPCNTCNDSEILTYQPRNDRPVCYSCSVSVLQAFFCREIIICRKSGAQPSFTMVKIQEGVLGNHPDVGPGKYPLCSRCRGNEPFPTAKKQERRASSNQQGSGWVD